MREEILKRAIAVTMGSRNREYGKPSDNLGNIADLWTAYFLAKFRGSTLDERQFILTAEDVAHLNILQKMARTFTGVPKLDTYDDMAAYSAIAGEVRFENFEGDHFE